MIQFWNSTRKITSEGIKVAWFGIAVVFAGLLCPAYKWLAWFGLAATITGLILRQRGEHLKKIQSAPRILTPIQVSQIVDGLKNIPKQPMTIGFYGQDAEAEHFANQFKQVFESVSFNVVRLEGFVPFKLSYGLIISVPSSESQNLTALGIHKALQSAGLEIKYMTIESKIDPPISLNIHGKPPSSD